MSSSRPNIDYKRLVREYLDGVITESDFEVLNTLLKEDAHVRRYYVQLSSIHGDLHLWSNRVHAAKVSPGALPSPGNDLGVSSSIVHYPVMKLAALIMICLVSVSLYLMLSDPKPVLTMSLAPNSRILTDHEKNPSENTPKDQLYAGSTLRVLRGSVELNFSSGVRSIVTAPAELRVNDDMLVELDSGNAWFRVPDEAHGFTVQTGQFEVEDLGTDFGVSASRSESDEVHVMKGEVVAHASSGRADKSHVREEEAMKVESDGELVSIPVRRFQDHLPTTGDYMHWGFERYEKEGFSVSGSSAQLGKANVLSAKPGFENYPHEGRSGRALLLDGESYATELEGFDVKSKMTIAFWVKVPSQAEAVGSNLMSWAIPNSSSRFDRVALRLQPIANRGLALHLACSGNVTGVTPLNDGEWHHVALVFSDEVRPGFLPKFKMFIDGREEQRVSAFADDQYVYTDEDDRYTGQSLVFGEPSSSALNYLKARQDILLDEVYFIFEALEADEIERLMKENKVP